MNTALKNVTLRRGKSESLLRFHPWVFSGAIAHADDGIQEGDVVRVLSHEGETLGVGHAAPGSIAVRILSFTETPIDGAFYAERLHQALCVRRRLGLVSRQDHDIFRWVHGEGDRLPGLVVDVYGKTAVMQAHSVGMHLQRHVIAKALMAEGADLIENVYYKSETTLPFKAECAEKDGFLIGGQSAGNIATENGLHFHIDWLKGQKTGFFVDQRENRSLLERYSRGRRVLNMFCYTGGFSVYALRGGAELVHSVDSSQKAVDLVRQNVQLNDADGTWAARHEAFCEDAFRYLGHAATSYDLIILDPPAFAKHKDALRNALKGYTRLNAAAFEQIRPGGILFTFSCSQAVSARDFRLAVFTAAASSRRHVRILHQLHQPADHPVSIYHPEGEYLKGLVLEVD